LLLVLVVVALTTWQDRYRSTRWRQPLFVALYPIAADESPVTRSYIDALDDERFKAIDRFFMREAARYRLPTDEPIRTRLQPELRARPPERGARDGALATAWWSLKLRYWAWSVSRHAHEPEDIRIFVLYRDPALTPTVPHSLGLTTVSYTHLDVYKRQAEGRRQYDHIEIERIALPVLQALESRQAAGGIGNRDPESLGGQEIRKPGPHLAAATDDQRSFTAAMRVRRHARMLLGRQ